MAKEVFRYIPKGAVKIADKNSDAVAYCYPAQNGQPAVRIFYGKQGKPALACYFVDFKSKTAQQQRADKIASYFASRQAWAKAKADRAAKRKAQGRGVEVGQYMVASWGYDQTNVDFYRVVNLIGRTMAEVVKVGAISVSADGNMCGKVIPAEEIPAGAKPFRVVVKDGRATIRGQFAKVWDGMPEYVSWYA